MLLDRYEYEVGVPYHQYGFYSDGPKGRIRKAILYTFIGTWLAGNKLVSLIVRKKRIYGNYCQT